MWLGGKVDDKVDGYCIRYGCPCGSFSTIGELFFSDICNKPVCRSPSCSVQEIDAYFCSYMRENLPSKEASMNQNRSVRVFSCVSCENTLSTVSDDTTQQYFFFCSHCRWDSLDIGLVEDDPAMLVMSAVAREKESTEDDIYQTLRSHYTTPPPSHRASLRSSRSFKGDSSTSRLPSEHLMRYSVDTAADIGPWKVEQAMERLLEREKWVEDQKNEHQWPELKKQMAQFGFLTQNFTTNETLINTREDIEQTDTRQVSTLAQRLRNPSEQPRRADQLAPCRPLLRIKRTWRCVESISKGSPGILVKPNIHPTRGDSSVPGSASWFKKANLAVHYMPLFSFLTEPAGETASPVVSCSLLVENPVDERLRLVFKGVDASKYTAEAVLDGVSPIVVAAYEDPNLIEHVSPTLVRNNRKADGILLDSFRNFVKLKLQIRKTSVGGETVGRGESELSFGLQVEVERLEEDTEEAIDGSFFTFPIEFILPN